MQLQIDAGANAVMLFDTWGGLLPARVYEEYSLDPMRQIIQKIKLQNPGKEIPVLMFTKGGGVWLEKMAESGADVLGLDWTISLAKAREQLNTQGKKISLQGNLDPLLLLSNPLAIESAVTNLFKELALTSPIETDLSPLDGHIFNLGHGISQFTPPENVATLVDSVIQNSSSLRKSK